MYTLIHCNLALTVLDPHLVPGVVMRHVPGPWSHAAVSLWSGEGTVLLLYEERKPNVEMNMEINNPEKDAC